jgi:integrase/recombinase XerD
MLVPIFVVIMWEKYFKLYLNYLRIERGLSPRTIENYYFDLTKLSDFVAQNQINENPIHISNDTLQHFLFETSKQISSRSLARLISALKGFFNYLALEEFRTDHPMQLTESPKIGRKLPQVLSTIEIDALIAAIDLSKAEGERNKAILETLYGCGLRVSELVDLKISDLFFDEGFIRVTGKGNKQRLIPIPELTQKCIDTYKNKIRVHHSIERRHSDILFLNRRGKPLTRAMIFTIIKQLAAEIGLQKNISPHTFRHSFASHLLENGADLRSIQLMLGHESITTTEIYMHLDKSMVSELLLKYHPRNHF